MSVHFCVDKGSGRGACGMCGKKIKKGAWQVVAIGWRESGRASLSCVLKELKFKKKLERRKK